MDPELLDTMVAAARGDEDAEPSDELLCAVCFHLMVDAVCLVPCGHTSCTACFRRLRTCMLCRQHVSAHGNAQLTSVPNWPVRNLVSAIKVKCCNSFQLAAAPVAGSGAAAAYRPKWVPRPTTTSCRAELTIGNICAEVSSVGVGCTRLESMCSEDHVKSCPYEWVQCPHAASGCSLKLTRFQLKHHLAEECKYLSCEACKAIVSRESHHQHKDVCNEASVECPNVQHGCYTLCRRKDLEEHLRECVVTRLLRDLKECNCKIANLQQEARTIEAELEERKTSKQVMIKMHNGRTQVYHVHARSTPATLLAEVLTEDQRRSRKRQRQGSSGANSAPLNFSSGIGWYFLEHNGHAFGDHEPLFRHLKRDSTINVRLRVANRLRPRTYNN